HGGLVKSLVGENFRGGLENFLQLFVVVTGCRFDAAGHVLPDIFKSISGGQMMFRTELSFYLKRSLFTKDPLSLIDSTRGVCVHVGKRMQFENVIVDKDGAIAVVTLNRPQQLNALSYGLVKDLCLATECLNQDDEVRVIILTGGEKVFAAGADIKEMADA